MPVARIAADVRCNSMMWLRTEGFESTKQLLCRLDRYQMPGPPWSPDGLSRSIFPFMKRSVYLDNAATTPVSREVLDAMLPYLSDQTFGNPSSAHGAGRAAKGGVETARRQVANAVGAKPTDV